MRYSSTINNVKALEWDLNIQQAYLFAWMYELPSWAEKTIIGTDVYFFASKNKACDELPLLTDKPDTMYRYYKQLEEIELIRIKKIDSKDYICLTDKGKSWNFRQSERSENFPSAGNNLNIVGNLSESTSENFPTDNFIIQKDNIINNKNTTELFSDVEVIPIHHQVIQYLNLKRYGPTPKPNEGFRLVKSNFTEINARLKEKFTLEDFKKVIDGCVSNPWFQKDENVKYLQPSTLFSSKMNGYLASADMHINSKQVDTGSNNFVSQPMAKAVLKEDF